MDNLCAFECLHSLAQFVHLSCHRCQRFREGIVNLFRVGNHNPFAVAEDNMARNADHRRILGHASQHDRTRAYPAVPPNRNVAENFRSPTNHHLVFNSRMPLAVLFASASERDALIQSHVVADDRSLPDDHTKPMIDEQPTANLGSGMNFDSGQEARHLREPSPKKKEIMVPQPVIDAVEPYRVQPCVAEENFETRLGGWVALQHRDHVFAN